MSETLKVQIRSFLKEGQFGKAKKAVLKFSKIKPCGWQDRILISEFFLWLGNPKDGIKILESLLNYNELRAVSVGEICVQIRLAFMLAFTGAHQLASKQYQVIERVVKERRLNLDQFFPKYYQYLAHFFLSSYKYEESLKTFKKSMTLQDSNSDTYKYAKIGVADCLDGMGEYQEAIQLVTDILSEAKEEEKILKAICFQARGEYLFREGYLEKAKSDYDKSLIYFSSELETKDGAYLLRCIGAYWILKKNFLKAKENLLKALRILNQQNAQPIAVMGVLYWLDQLPNYKLNIGLKISLCCHYSFSHYSLLAGRQVNENLAIHPWFQKRMIKTKNDCWVIKGNTIFAKEYDKLENDIFIDKTVLDLFSGVLIKNKFNLALSEVQIRCLAAIIGAGDLGITVWPLMDFIYDQDFYSIENGLMRIDDLIRRLSKDFPIQREKNYYFFKRDSNTTYILNMDLNSKGAHRFLKRNRSSFTRKDVEEIFQITSSTAKRWIAEWTDKNYIKNNGVLKSSYYVWKDNLI